MTRLSSLVGGGGGPHYSDPRFLPRGVVSPGNLFSHKAATAGLQSTQSGYWTGGANSVDKIGAQIDSNFTAGVAKQIVNISGAGILAAVIGPRGTSPEVTTFTIVVDGVTYSIPITFPSGSARAFLGYLYGSNASSLTDVRASVEPAIVFGSSTPSFCDASPSVSSNLSLVDANMFALGRPLVQFNTSLTISITHSANVTDTANQERRSGAYYWLRA